MENLNHDVSNDAYSKYRLLVQKANLSIIEKVVVAIIFLRFCYPANSFFGDSGSYIIYYGLYFIFFMLSIFNNSISIRHLIKDTWILFVLLIIIIARSVLAKNLGFGFSDPMRMTIMIGNMIIAYNLYLYIRTRGEYFQKIIVLTALIGLSITILFSIYYVTFVDYLAVRNATRVNIGVGDFNLIYSIIFLAIICFVNFNFSKYIHQKVIMIFIFIITLLLIIKANFMTALLLFLVASVLTFIMGIATGKKRIIALSSLFFIGILFFFFKTQIGTLLINLANANFFSWVINEKIIVVGDQLRGMQGDLETLGIRMEKITYTLQTFYQNPYFGVSYNNYNAFTIGGHAQWFDDLARFGFLGMVLWVSFYLTVFRRTLIKIEDEASRLSTQLAWLLFIVLGFLNPNTMSTVTMMLLTIIPFSGALIINKKRSEYGE